VERLVRQVVGRISIDRGARIEQQPSDLGFAEERREVEGAVSVGREPVDALGIVIDVRADPVDATHSRRLEKVELRIGGKECVEGRPIEPVPREQHRRHAVLATRGR
jgi:hypothetical protein